MNSTTLHVGSLAPDFSISALNAPSPVSLRSLLQRGLAILEFIRGTW